jgi:hypothetical protein
MTNTLAQTFIADVAQRLADNVADEGLSVVNDGLKLALTLRRAVQVADTTADIFTVQWMTDFLPHMHGLTGLLFRSAQVKQTLYGGFHVDMDELQASILLFADGSFMRFSEVGYLQEDELDLREPDFQIEDLFKQDDDIEVLGATPDLLAKHPDLKQWQASVPKTPDYDDISDAIASAIVDQDDPPVDDQDLASSSNWSDEDASSVEEIVILAWAGLGMTKPCDIRIMSSTEEGDEAYIENESHDRDFDPQDMDEKLHDIITTFINLADFIGQSWEYNDGAHDRKSGYSPYSECVAHVSFDPSCDISKHALLSAPDRLREKLIASGKTPQQVQEMMTIKMIEHA